MIPIFSLLVVIASLLISGLPFDLITWWLNRKKRDLSGK